MDGVETLGDVKLKASEFIELLKKSGLMVGPKTAFGQNYVEGIPLEDYRRRILQKTLITPAEITKGKLWGEITEPRVRQIIKEQVPEEEQVVVNSLKIPRLTVL